MSDIGTMKPSELIRHALTDLEKCEREGYWIDMSVWHVGSENEDMCRVCLAGAVMAQTMGGSRKEDINPLLLLDDGRIDEASYNALIALDAFVSGQVESGAAAMKICEDDLPEGRHVPRYEDDPEKFKEAMFELVGELERCGV